MQIDAEPTLDVPLADICIATSAAPTYLPAHYFEKKDENGKVIKEYNLIDGGVCANNPVRATSRVKYIEKTSSLVLKIDITRSKK